MIRCFIVRLLFLLIVSGFQIMILASESTPGTAASRPKPTWYGAFQTGLQSEFQLNLGGRFGPGPAFFNRLTLGVTNAVHRGDSLSVMAFSTFDLSRRVPDDEFAFWYHSPVLKAGGNRFRVGATWQRWVYPSVLRGARDWATGGQLQFSRNVGAVPIVLTTDVRTNVVSNLQRGTLLVSNLSTSRRIWGGDRRRLVLRHGPSYAHAWGMYGKYGQRQWRYNGSLVWEQGRHAIELAGRKQFGLQPGIPDNPYWCVNWTVGFGRR